MIKDKRIEREHAVSPVVGIMLMLVVTIIIAAVVSAFAGGLVTGKEKAPQVSLETHIQLVHDHTYGEYATMTIKHLGGDPINTKNVKLVTSWANASGVYHVGSTVAPTYNATTGANDVSSLNTDYYGAYNEPYLVVPGVVPGGDNTLWFGNYIMRAGDVMKAYGNLNSDNTVTDKKIVKDVILLTGNEIVNVKLIDLNSGSTIYDKNVIVEV